MYMVYADESGTDPWSDFVFFGALVLDSNDWKSVFAALKAFRAKLAKEYHIPFTDDVHSSELIGGRGNFARYGISKKNRYIIYRDMLNLISDMKVNLFQIKCSKRSDADSLGFAFDCLLNRLERFLKAKDSLGILISHRGLEKKYTTYMQKKYTP